MRSFFVRYGWWVLGGSVPAWAVTLWGNLLTGAHASHAWWIAQTTTSLIAGLVMLCFGLLLVSNWRGVTAALVEREIERSRSKGTVEGYQELRLRHLRVGGWCFVVGGLILTISGAYLVLSLVVS